MTYPIEDEQSDLMDSFLESVPKGTTKKRKVENGVERNEKVQKKAQVTQMYLDFGQKSFNTPKTCEKCGLLYVQTDGEDQKRHARVDMPLAASPSLFTKLRLLSTQEEHGSIYQLPLKPIRLPLPVLEKFFLIAEGDVGARAGFANDGHTAYICAIHNMLVGLLVVDEVSISRVVEISEYDQLAFTLAPSCPNVSQPPTEDTSVLTYNPPPPQTPPPLEQENIPAYNTPFPYLGVRLIYTHERYRRRMVAVNLLEAARRFHMYGQVVSKDRLAFSQPTEMGFLFAKKYIGKDK
eukprot:gene41565-50725_t